MVIVAGIIAAHGVSGLLMVTMMAGVILLGMAVTGLGTGGEIHPPSGHDQLHGTASHC